MAPYRGNLRDVWSNNPITRNEFISQRFPRKLFEKIKGALHWVENRRFSKEEKQNNKSYKIKTSVDDWIGFFVDLVDWMDYGHPLDLRIKIN